ncbi:hypothetical protein EV363DRAFT_502393 [Boletus edulis]|nr:hypothetical protein EV363DRAFT_502393 [Boletus edulis]
MVLINQVSVQSPGNWEVQCQDQLQMLGLSASSVLLKSVRRHWEVSSPEYEDDAQTLIRLIRQHALQNHRDILTLNLDHGVGILTPSPDGGLVTSFRCGWVTVLSVHSESICNCIVRQSDLLKHLRRCHGIGGPDKAFVICRWGGCNKHMLRQSLVRHVRGLHLWLRYVCSDCLKSFSRPDTLQTHMKYCTRRRQTPS